MSTNSFLKLIKYHDQLEHIDYTKIMDELAFFEGILAEQLPDVHNKEHHEKLMKELDTVRDILENSELSQLKGFFSDIVKRREGNYLRKGYELYDQDFSQDTWKDVIRQYKQQDISEDVMKIVIGKIGKHTKWEAPGMELSPGQGKFTKHLIAMDPLFVVDKHQKIIDNVKRQFNTEYQNRLRTYTDLQKLPKNQMGMIFSWGFFERLPMDMIKDYLKEFYTLLRPGGVVLMSYNNCLNRRSLELTATKTRAYNSLEYMEPLVYSCGFDDLQNTDIDPHFSLLEFKKPGEFTSQRTGQTLGEIKIDIGG